MRERVLVISPIDSAEVRNFLSKGLGTYRYDLIVCESVGEALASIEAERPINTILLECSLPSSDNLMNMRLLKAHSGTTSANIILLCDWADRKAYIDHPEAWAVLNKPFHHEDLKTFLECSAEDRKLFTNGR